MPADPEQAERFRAELGVGEAEALALALGFDRSWPVLLDDRKARRVAHDLGLSVVGSAGVLLVAKERGFISTVSPLLRELRRAGLYLSDAAASRLLAAANDAVPDPGHA